MGRLGAPLGAPSSTAMINERRSPPWPNLGRIMAECQGGAEQPSTSNKTKQTNVKDERRDARMPGTEAEGTAGTPETRPHPARADAARVMRRNEIPYPLTAQHGRRRAQSPQGADAAGRRRRKAQSPQGKVAAAGAVAAGRSRCQTQSPPVAVATRRKRRKAQSPPVAAVTALRSRRRTSPPGAVAARGQPPQDTVAAGRNRHRRSRRRRSRRRRSRRKRSRRRTKTKRGSTSTRPTSSPAKLDVERRRRAMQTSDGGRRERQTSEADERGGRARRTCEADRRGRQERRTGGEADEREGPAGGRARQTCEADG
jgi:hypothetical protein